MNKLEHIVEPSRLLLTWQPADERVSPRTRRVVAEITNANGQVFFRYLKDTSDFEAAKLAGFVGFPAFDLKQTEFNQDVVESLIRRLPPRNREDFSEYLALHRLPYPFNYSDIALLGYTGARLPSDGFSLVPEFPKEVIPCDYLLEVAGVRHVLGGAVDELRVGDPVSFALDTSNPVDANALVVMHQGKPIGYVNRALRDSFHYWISNYHVSGTLERLNGRPDRPLVYVRVSVS